MAIQDTSDSEEKNEKSISIGGAFVRSALIPGWGQKSLGANKSARNFFVADVAMWLGVAAFNVYGGWLKDDYRLLAAEHASVNVDGKSDKYFVDVSNFNNIDEFNQSRLRRRDPQAQYDPATHFWQWDSETNRDRYDRIRLRSDKAFSRGELVIGAILVNHLISGIHAAWLANKKKQPAPEDSEQKASERSASVMPNVQVKTNGEEVRLEMKLQF